MPLTKQNISIALAGGIDRKTDPKQVVIGKLLVLENGIFTSKNRVKKRNGYKNIGTAVTGLSGAAVFKDELVVFSQGGGFSSYDAGSDRFISKPTCPSLNIKQLPVYKSDRDQSAQDGVQHPAGFSLFAWADSSGGLTSVTTDDATGLRVRGVTAITGAYSLAKTVVFGNYAVLFAVKSASNELDYFWTSAGDPTLLNGPFVLTTDLKQSNSWCYDATASGQRLFITYPGTTNFTTKWLDSTLSLRSGSLSLRTPITASAINIVGSADSAGLLVSWITGSAVGVQRFDYDLTVTTGLDTAAAGLPTPMKHVTGQFSTPNWLDGNYKVFTDRFVAGTGSQDEIWESTVVANSGSHACIWGGVSLAGKSFYSDAARTQLIVPAVHDSALQSTYFLVDDRAAVWSKEWAQLAGGQCTGPLLPESSQISATFMLPQLFKDHVQSVSGNLFTTNGVGKSLVDFDSPSTAFRTAELGNNLHIGGGFLRMYDGGPRPTEHGFHLFPEGISASIASAGVLTSSQYAATYEWSDTQGQVHRSAPSVPFIVSTSSSIGPSAAVTVSVPDLRITEKIDTPVQVVLYRTVGNVPVNFYRVASASVSAAKTATSSTLIDTTTDAVLQGNGLLYTAGGVVENVSPNPCSSMTVYANRIVLLDTTQPLVLWYSKQVIPSLPVEFSDLFTLNIDPRGGDCTAVATLDDKLIVFKENQIFYVTGQGPTPTGDQNDFNSGFLISTDGGCTDARSVVLTPGGLMYKSRKGIYLLDRSLQASYIGAEVEAFNGDSVTSAVLVPNTTQVRFTLSSGAALVYDYLFGQWSVFTNISAAGACVYQSEYVYSNPAGLVRSETPGVFSDVSSPIRLKMTTSWLSLAGLQGFQRAYKLLVLGDWLGDHKLQVDAAFDFDPTPFQTVLIDTTQVLSPSYYGVVSPYGADAVYGGEFPAYQWRIFLSRQKCQAVQFTLQDVQTSSNEGLALSVLSLEVGLKKGLNKLAARKSFG